jgi:hypothetical protein
MLVVSYKPSRFSARLIRNKKKDRIINVSYVQIFHIPSMDIFCVENGLVCHRDIARYVLHRSEQDVIDAETVRQSLEIYIYIYIVFPPFTLDGEK